jgi:UDP-N-acetylmuramate: L-alanyl-gamma-D-glutamyl-meso-diaminopimelate ligase
VKFHFSGICGAGMGNVACLLQEAGHQVKGSDQNVFPPMSLQLERLGVTLLNGYNEAQVEAIFTPDIQVISNALPSNHVEVLAGKMAGVTQMSFPDVLERFILPGRKSYVVAGTHGKTTTSSILAHLMRPIGAGAFVGGVMKNGDAGCHLGELTAPFVLEGDEYDTAFFDKHSKFLHYKPKVLILTHLEWDHVDIFPSFEDMLKEFRALISLLPSDGLVIYCGDHGSIKDLLVDFKGQKISYGIDPENDVCLKSSRPEGAAQVLTLTTPWGAREIRTSLIGKIYHLNLLGAWLAAHLGEGLSWEALAAQLGGFSGAQRRLELLASKPQIVISDFAHHPTAVAETLRLVRENWPTRRLVAIFDPRNATSRRNVFENRLAESLSLADVISIAPPPQDLRLTDKDRLNPKALLSKIAGSTEYFEDGSSFVQGVLSILKADDVVVVMSCGSCYGLLGELKSKTSLEP